MPLQYSSGRPCWLVSSLPFHKVPNGCGTFHRERLEIDPQASDRQPNCVKVVCGAVLPVSGDFCTACSSFIITFGFGKGLLLQTGQGIHQKKVSCTLLRRTHFPDPLHPLALKPLSSLRSHEVECKASPFEYEVGHGRICWRRPGSRAQCASPQPLAPTRLYGACSLVSRTFAKP